MQWVIELDHRVDAGLVARPFEVHAVVRVARGAPQTVTAIAASMIPIRPRRPRRSSHDLTARQLGTRPVSGVFPPREILPLRVCRGLIGHHDFDVAIASHALALDAIVATANVKHFERVTNLRVEDWTAVAGAG